jgi:hypothetical protein
VILVVSIFGVSQYGGVHADPDRLVLERVSSLRAAIRDMHQGRNGYGDSVFPRGNALSRKLIAADVVPHGLRPSGDSMLSESDGVVSVDGDASSFWIVYPGMSYGACLVATTGTDMRWLGIVVNGGSFISTEGESKGSARAAQFCRERSGNVIAWRSN